MLVAIWEARYQKSSLDLVSQKGKSKSPVKNNFNLASTVSRVCDQSHATQYKKLANIQSNQMSWMRIQQKTGLDYSVIQTLKLSEMCIYVFLWVDI